MNKNKIYKPIMSKLTVEAFSQYFDSLSDPYIDYLAVGIQHPETGTSTSIMSRQDWQSEFNKNGYAEFDPLRKAVLSTQRSIFSINDIDHCDARGAEIMKRRHYYDICGGLVLIKRLPSHNIMITCASGYDKFDFENYIAKYSANIRHIQEALLGIIESETHRFLHDITKTSHEML